MQMRPFTSVMPQGSMHSCDEQCNHAARTKTTGSPKWCYEQHVQTGVTTQPVGMMPMKIHRSRFYRLTSTHDELRPRDDSFLHGKVGINTKTAPGSMSRVCSQQQHSRAAFLRIPFG